MTQSIAYVSIGHTKRECLLCGNKFWLLLPLLAACYQPLVVVSTHWQNVQLSLWSKPVKLCKKFHLRGLPFLARLTHPKSRHHILMCGSGVTIMLVGSTLATCGHSQGVLPHFLWDAMSYLIHGIGAIPIMHHAEHMYHIFIPESNS